MHEVRDKVKERFREMEREIIISTLGVKPGGGGMERRRTITRGPPGKNNMKRQSTLNLSERIQINMVPDDAVSEFLAHELRIQRYNVLTRILEWRVLIDEYRDQVEMWRHGHAVAEFMAGEDEDYQASRHDCPIQPGCPSHIPHDDDLLMWVTRLRRDPENPRLTPVPKPSLEREQRQAEEAERGAIFHKPSKDWGGRPKPRALLSARDYLPKVLALEKAGMVQELVYPVNPAPQRKPTG
jgi:hypothetical protein